MSSPSVYTIQDNSVQSINFVLKRLFEDIARVQAGVNNFASAGVHALIGTLTGNLTLTTTFTSIAGVDVKLDRKGQWLIVIAASFSANKNDNFPQVQLLVGAAAESDKINCGTTNGTNDEFSGVGQWIISSRTGAEICVAQGKKVGGSGNSAIIGITTITAIWVGP